MLSSEQKKTYWDDGVLCPIQVLRSEEVERFRTRFEELEGLADGPLKYISRPHLFFPWAAEICSHPAIVDAVADLLGEEVLVASSLVLCKYPHSPEFAAWHQDGRYDGGAPNGSVSAWVALTPSRAESGCMRVIPGSHAEGLQPHAETWDQRNLLLRGVEIQVSPDESRARDLELRPGEMSLHHNNIVHGSEPNRSDQKRVGFIIRYTSPPALDPADRDNVVAVRGPGAAARTVDDHADQADAFARCQAHMDELAAGAAASRDAAPEPPPAR